MSVPQFTTPTITLTFSQDGLDLTEAVSVYVSFRGCRNMILTKTGVDLEVSAQSIGVYLSQQDTAMLGIGSVEIQANWTMVNGARAASTIARCDISDQLLKKVLE